MMKTSKVMHFLVACMVAFLLFNAGSLMATDAVPETAAKEAVEGAAGAAGAMDLLNINTASVDALAKIPGIGPKIGEAIAAYREANGAFSSLSDLVNVEGIDASLVEKIKPFLTL